MHQHGARLVDAVHVLAANLNRLVEWHRDKGTGLGSNAALGAKAGVSSNTIGRMRRADGSVGIGKLSRVAKALNLQANQLLTPGLVPEAPPEVVTDEAEKHLLRAFRDRRNPPEPPKLVSSK